MTKERDYFNKLYSSILRNGVRQDENGEWTKINSGNARHRLNGDPNKRRKNTKPWVPPKVLITPIEVENKWHEQDGRCYWFGLDLDLGLLYNDHPDWYPMHPLAPSVDKINPDGDYEYDNIVICTRMANFGRSLFPFNEFHSVVAKIAESMLSRETAPGYIRQILSMKQQQKAMVEDVQNTSKHIPKMTMEDMFLINPKLKDVLKTVDEKDTQNKTLVI
jgi:hypothetical protein